jgi:hypothetical protein
MQERTAILVLRSLHAATRIETERTALALAIALLERENSVQALAGAAIRASRIARDLVPESTAHAELAHFALRVVSS